MITGIAVFAFQQVFVGDRFRNYTKDVDPMPRQPSIAKISRPRLPEILPRQRLFRALDRSRKQAPVTWISGPPGSGKTTLVASYLDARKLPCLWYQLDEGDGDIATFFYYLGLAGKNAAPRVRNPLPLLTPEYLLDVPTFSKRFFENLCSRLRTRFTLVFDNYQEVPAESPFSEIVQTGLSALPEGIHAFIISRAEPPQAFIRMLAGKALDVIGWESLRLTTEESKGIARLHCKVPKQRRMAPWMNQKADGWAAGLILFMQAWDAFDPQSLPDMTPEMIFDYFANELFDKINKELQDFLLKTAVLPKITPVSAKALTGEIHADRILSELNRKNYFTEKRKLEESTYQYHPLFRAFLQRRVERVYAETDQARIRLAAAKALEGSGEFEDAADLYRQAGEWRSFIRLILTHAQTLLTQGRASQLQKWLHAVPAEIREQSAWLLFWAGACRMAYDPSGARQLLEKAYASFEEQQDAPGMFLSWSAIVDSFYYEWKDLDPLDRWISELENLLRKFSSIPSAEIEARVSISMFAALCLRQPFHPQLPLWEERVTYLMQRGSDPNARLSGYFLMLHNVMKGDFRKADWVYDTLSKSAQPTNPAELVTAKVHQAYYFWAKGDHGESLRTVASGLDAAERSGVHIWNFTLSSIGAYTSLASDDPETADRYLAKMSRFLDSRRLYDVSHYHYILGWQAMMRGNVPLAHEHAKVFLELLGPVAVFTFTGFNQIAGALISFAAGAVPKAFAHLKRAREIGRRSKSSFVEYRALLAKAYFELEQGNDRDGLQSLHDALTLGREKGFFSFEWWLPSMMARLCSSALEHGIEVHYVQDLIKRHGLLPDIQKNPVEHWPFPLKIYTLGRFDLLKDDKPVTFSGKVQKKPLELLKVLVAFGGRDVREDHVIDALWPEAPGDLAHKSYEMALQRLRRLIGNEKAVRLREGLLTLDDRLCWTDVRAFEKAVESSEFGAQSSKIKDTKRKSTIRNSQSEIMQRLDKAIALYKGHFLPSESRQPWATVIRERLRSKFLRLVVKAGEELERQGEWKKGVEYFEMGLERDPVCEEFYQHLMVCHDRLGHRAEAARTYQRCRSTLLDAFGIEPSSRTEEIHSSIRSKG